MGGIVWQRDQHGRGPGTTFATGPSPRPGPPGPARPAPAKRKLVWRRDAAAPAPAPPTPPPPGPADGAGVDHPPKRRRANEPPEQAVNRPHGRDSWGSALQRDAPTQPSNPPHDSGVHAPAAHAESESVPVLDDGSERSPTQAAPSAADKLRQAEASLHKMQHELRAKQARIASHEVRAPLTWPMATWIEDPGLQAFVTVAGCPAATGAC